MTGPDLTATTVEALVAMLKRRRMLFELMTGTVAPLNAADRIDSTDVVGDTGQIKVILDGDTVPTNAQSMVGTVVMGSRVPVLYVPPTGYYIIGFLDVVPGTVVYYEQIKSLNTSTTALTEQIIYTTTLGPLGSGQVLFKNGHAYFIEVWSQSHCAVAQNPSALVRLTDLSGTVVLAGPRLQLPASNLDVPFDKHGYVINNTGADLLRVLAVTLTLQSANAVTFGTASAIDQYIKVTDVGDISGYPGAKVVA